MVFFTLLCERSAKRDMGHILYYLTIELDHAKRDSRLAAYGGVLLQRLEGLTDLGRSNCSQGSGSTARRLASHTECLRNEEGI